MFVIDPAEYAQPFLRKLVAEHNLAEGRNAEDFKAIVMGRRHDGADAVQHPALRDRTEEYRRMLAGFGGSSSRISAVRYTGEQLCEKFGFKPVGAQFAATYDILWIS